MKILVWLNARLQTKLATKKFTWSIHLMIMNHALRKQYLLCNLHGHPISFLILDLFDLQLMEPVETPKLKIKMSTVAYIWSQQTNWRNNKPKNALVIPKYTVPVKMIPTRQFNCIKYAKYFMLHEICWLKIQNKVYRKDDVVLWNFCSRNYRKTMIYGFRTIPKFIVDL